MERNTSAFLSRRSSARGAHRRLHGDQRQHLHQVVLHHVAQRADRVVEAAPVLHPEVLGHRDLHAGHVVPVPHRLEELVGEPDVLDVEHRLLAEEVVDPQDLVFGRGGGQVGVELARRGQVVAERLLHRHPGTLGEPGLAQGARPRGRTGWAGSPGRTAGARRRTAPWRAACTGRSSEKSPLRYDMRRASRLNTASSIFSPAVLDRLPGALDQLLLRPVLPGDGDDLFGQAVTGLEPVQGPERLLLRQVPGDAKNDERIRLWCLFPCVHRPPHPVAATARPWAARMTLHRPADSRWPGAGARLARGLAATVRARGCRRRAAGC